MSPAKQNDIIKKKFTFDGVEFDLTDRQKFFAMEYVRNKFNGRKAAIAAGYSTGDPNSAACRLLALPDVATYIDKLKQNIGEALGISALDIAREYARIGFADIRKIFDENGALITIKNLSSKAAANVASIEIFEVKDAKGNKIGETKKMRLYNKIEALDKLARMLGVDGVTKVAATKPDGSAVDLGPMATETETILRFRLNNGDEKP